MIKIKIRGDAYTAAWYRLELEPAEYIEYLSS